MTDDLELSIETTWIEETGTNFDRVVVLNFFTSDCLSSSGERMQRTVGQPLRDRVSAKIESEVGLIHLEDYIFHAYDDPVMRNGKWAPAPLTGDMRTVIRIKDEEHFTMFKLHYHGN